MTRRKRQKYLAFSFQKTIAKSSATGSSISSPRAVSIATSASFFELTKERQLDWLDKIFSIIVSNGHITVLDGILKRLIGEWPDFQMLFELAINLSESGKLIVFPT